MKIILCAADMAVIAKGLLDENGGFTIDEFGHTPQGPCWAVSKEGKEGYFPNGVSLHDIENYLLRRPILEGAADAYFGGWVDENRITYLDHTLLFARRNTAIHEAIRNGQRAIFNLETRETLDIGVSMGAIEYE